MEDTKVVAIVGNYISYKENDVFARLLTRGEGNILATARGVKKATAKLKYAVSLFNIGKYNLCGKMNIIKECVQIDSLSDITLDVEKYYAGCYILENFAKINEKSRDTKIFDETIEILTDLTYGNISAQDAQKEFILRMLKCNGFDKSFTSCNICGAKLDCAAFDVEGGVVCRPCSNPSKSLYITRESINYIQGKEVSEKDKKNTLLLLEEIIYYYIGIKFTKNKFSDI